MENTYSGQKKINFLSVKYVFCFYVSDTSHSRRLPLSDTKNLLFGLIPTRRFRFLPAETELRPSEKHSVDVG